MIFDAKLAERVRDELFDEDERRLLTAVEGATYIDVADQLLTSYGGGEIRSGDLNKFLKDFAVFKFREGRHLIGQLRVLKEKLEELLNPEFNYSKLIESGNSNVNTIGDGSNTIKGVDGSGAFNYLFSESSQNNKGGVLNRTANTQTSQENKTLEAHWRKTNQLDIGSGQLVGEKQYDPNKVLQEEKILDVKEAHYEVIPQEQEEYTEPNQEMYSTLNTQISGQVSHSYYATGQKNLSLNRRDSVNNIEREDYSNTDSTRNKELSSYIQNDANIKAIRREIPNLQSKFFNIFEPLFRVRG